MCFFNKLNQIHPQIQFTAEYEIENQLPFLDVLVEKGTNNNLQLSVYRKPTHTGLYINWLSFVPYRYKLNLIKCLLDKAFKICSNRPLMQKEFDFISTLLGKNGYPKRLIGTQTRKFLRQKEKVVETTTRTKEQVKCVFFRLPYIGNVSNQIQKEIRQFIYKTKRFKYIMTHSTTTIGQKFQYKDQQSLLHITGAVYQLSCTCGKSYIGQTKRNLKFRFNEHKPSNSYKSDISKHLLENSSHLIDFNQPKILARDNNWRKLKIKETLFIQKLHPQLNIDETSHPLFLFNA